MTKLRISPDLTLAPDVITEALAILAARGAGKSNAAVVLAEEMYDNGLPWVAIDPKGDWHGIRSAGDGSAPGLSVVVFGGLHGDVPLEPTAGRLVADLTVDQRMTCVLDVSEMTKADQRRFLLDFAERLYRRNTEPLHVFCEEADEYIPQMVRGEAAKLVGAFETLVKRGRFRGLGVTLITQRSASLNKDVLTQVETLIAMRTPSPQDRKAILAWVDVHDAGRELVDQLPTLDSGEAWVFSPHALKVVKRIRFRRRRTFDSGATPKVGGKPRPPARLADVDLAAIKEAMADTIERAKADDPKELRKRIAELERELRDQPAPQPVRVEVPVLDDAARALIERVADQWDELYDRAAENVNALRDALDRVTSYSQNRRSEGATSKRIGSPPAQTPVTGRPTGHSAGRSTQSTSAPRASGSQVRPAGDGSPLSGPQQSILAALAWYESVGLTPAGKVQLAFFSGASSKSSAYANNLGALRTRGLIDYPRGGYVALTDAGRAVAPSDTTGPTNSVELQDVICDRLSRPQAAIVRALAAIAPMSLSKEELAVTVDASVTSSAFANNLGALRSLGFIDYPERGYVAATDVLFLESA